MSSRLSGRLLTPRRPQVVADLAFKDSKVLERRTTNYLIRLGWEC
jgi:hypothetical protein